MGQNFLEFLSMVKQMVRALFTIQMALFFQEILKMTKLVAMEPFKLKMASNMKEIGSSVQRTDTEAKT